MIMSNSTLDMQKQRLNQLIEQISNQETKLNRLKALCKQAKEQTATNAELNQELKSVNNTLREKDEELRHALNRVDNLNRQLNNYRRTRIYRNSKNVAASKQTTTLTATTATTAPISTTTDASEEITPAETITTGARNYKSVNSQSDLKGIKNINNLERRVSFDPLALLLDAALEGELDLVIQTSKQVTDLSASHDECVTALHNAVVAAHYEVAKYLIEAGCDINAQDNDGWTPLHCAASCNNLPLVKLLIENGALIYATTTSDNSTPAMECEQNEEGFEDCYKYLMFIQNNIGIINKGVVYALYDYEAQEEDELSFVTNEELIVVRRDDSQEQEWWWAQKRIQQQPGDKVVEIKEGYIPRNLVGLYPRVKAFKKKTNDSLAAKIPLHNNTNGKTASDSNEHDQDENH